MPIWHLQPKRRIGFEVKEPKARYSSPLVPVVRSRLLRRMEERPGEGDKRGRGTISRYGLLHAAAPAKCSWKIGGNPL